MSFARVSGRYNYYPGKTFIDGYKYRGQMRLNKVIFSIHHSSEASRWMQIAANCSPLLSQHLFTLDHTYTKHSVLAVWNIEFNVNGALMLKAPPLIELLSCCVKYWIWCDWCLDAYGPTHTKHFVLTEWNIKIHETGALMLQCKSHDDFAIGNATGHTM